MTNKMYIYKNNGTSLKIINNNMWHKIHINKNTYSSTNQNNFPSPIFANHHIQISCTIITDVTTPFLVCQFLLRNAQLKRVNRFMCVLIISTPKWDFVEKHTT